MRMARPTEHSFRRTQEIRFQVRVGDANERTLAVGLLIVSRTFPQGSMLGRERPHPTGAPPLDKLVGSPAGRNSGCENPPVPHTRNRVSKRGSLPSTSRLPDRPRAARASRRTLKKTEKMNSKDGVNRNGGFCESTPHVTITLTIQTTDSRSCKEFLL